MIQFTPSMTHRFWTKVDSSGDCWLWTACIVRRYGQFSVGGGRRVKAHRFAYELMRGEIPAGLQIDHLCRTPLCVRPAHMEVVTSRENTFRGSSPTIVMARTGICKWGHPFENNVYVDKRGGRQCLTCKRSRMVQLRRTRKAA